MQPLHEVISALDFGGHRIGARFRRDGDGRVHDRDAGWVAYWPDSAHRWIVEVARDFSERHAVYVRFSLDEVVQTWPWTRAVDMYGEGWIKVPSDWDPTTSDLKPLADEVLTALEAISPDQVRRIRSALDVSATDAEVH